MPVLWVFASVFCDYKKYLLSGRVCLLICSILQAEFEELRDDKATRVTQKELQEMFNELLLGYDNPATFQQEQEVLFSEFIDSQETKYVFSCI